MSKVAVVYWSQTGNTEAMANALADAAGTEAIEWTSFTADEAADYDAFAFGCPAMGAEELDPDFEELFNEVVADAGDKPFVLFGSYDWGTVQENGWTPGRLPLKIRVQMLLTPLLLILSPMTMH